MATPTYFKQPDTDCVSVSVYCADGRLRVSTGIDIPKEWFQSGKVRIGKKPKDVMEKVSRLESLQAKLQTHITDCIRADRPITKADLLRIIRKPKSVAKSIVSQIARPSEKRFKYQKGNNTSFFVEYARLIDMAVSGELTTPGEGTEYASDSLKLWKTNKRLLAEFSEEKGVSVEPDDLNIETIRAFTVWMNKKNYALNCVGIHNRHWKYIVKMLFKRGYHQNTIWTDETWKAKFELVEYPHLTDDEVWKIWEYQCPTQQLERARDRWVLEYCTGLRVKDSLRISMSHMGESTITIVNNKTGKKVVIPYHPILQSLLEKYNGEMPPKQSEQRINENMKIVAKSAGITDMYTYSKTIGGKLKHITQPRYELVTNHTARRSLVSNMIANGIPFEHGGDIVGMTRPTYDRYNKNSREKKAELVQGNPMFQKQSKLRKVS